MTVTLAKDVEERLAAQMAEAGVESADEFVNLALRHYLDPANLNELVEEAIAEVDRGETIDGDAFFRGFFNRIGRPLKANRP